MTTKIKSSNLSVPIDIVGDLNVADRIVHSGDTNTAIRFPAVDTVTVETTGVERLRVDASGNIGIGTSNPTAKLHVVGNLRSGNFFGTDGAYIEKIVEDASSAEGLTVYADNNRTSTVATSGTLSYGVEASAFLSSASDLTKTSQAGSVFGLSATALMNPNNGTTTALVTGVYGNVERLGSSTGVLTTGVGVQGSTGGRMLNSVSFRANGSTYGTPVTNQYGFYSDINIAQATNSWSVYANGDAYSYFGGRVGIGTTSPAEALDVVGSATFNAPTYCPVIVNSGTVIGQIAANANGSVDVRAVSNHPLTVFTNNTERMRITDNGNVGIGTIGPFGKIGSSVSFGNGQDRNFTAQAPGTAINQISGYSFQSTFGNTADTGPRRSADIWSGFNGGNWGTEYLAFGVGNNGAGNDVNNITSEKLRITAAGRVGIGTTSPTSLLHVVTNTGEPTAHFTGSGGPFVGIANQTTFSSGSAYCGVYYDARNEANIPVANFMADVNTDGSSAWSWTTQPAGTRTDRRVERMRIDGIGRLLLGLSDSVGSTSSAIFHRNSPFAYNAANLELISGAGDVVLGFHAGGSTAVCMDHVRGSTSLRVITGNRGAFAPILASAFTVNSDYRLKENLTPLTDATARVMQLPVHRFSFIENSMSYQNGQMVDGFLAHEVEDIVPEAVLGTKDAVNDSGDPVYQGIDQSKLVPLLTAALQEAIRDITLLKSRINELENSK